MTRGFPARLHVLLAAKAPVGLVFRRGPANAVCTVGWNRETDKFELGQWLRGRIYERRSPESGDEGILDGYFPRLMAACHHALWKGRLL